jgi:capsular exopolysaccharide synthesis family protein
MPSEGKTTLVNLLGRALADCGKRTLLVESDMRRPLLSRDLGIDNSGGLSLFLSGHISPLPKIQKTNHAGLFAVAAGPKAPNPLNLLNSKRMEDFIKEMTHSYQYVLLDAPPLLAVADARILCSKVDGVVLVVKAEHTPKYLIHRARTLLESSGANILGLALNQTSKSSFESSYYRHYYN